MKIYNPQLFQGSLNSNRYFEGWYFKHVSANREHVFSFIPGVALTKNDKHAFIQVIEGISGKTWNIKYPLSAFGNSENEFKIQVGNSFFSETEIYLDLHSENLKITGQLTYSHHVKFPSSVFSPGIMGWYSFVPFMECKHGICSVFHQINGSLKINSQTVDFTGGAGYIEKDWGTSFPESWIWLHCNTFEKPESSFTFSVAKIPWLGSFFIGHICFLYAEGKFHVFATYNGSKITKLTFHAPVLEIEINNKSHSLKVKAVQNKSGELKAPVIGKMNRMIKESIDSSIEIELFDNENKIIFSEKGTHAGLEIIEKILSYF